MAGAPNNGYSMAKTNYVSDAADVPEEALMDEPFCTIRLDLSQLPAQQQASLAQQLGMETLADDEQRAAIGAVITGANEEPWADVEAVLHVDVGRALTFLQSVGMLDMEPEVIDTTEDDDDGE